MPQPPVLKSIDWQAVYNSGKPWEEWIAAAQSSENRVRMAQFCAQQPLDAHVETMMRGLARAVYVVAIAEDWCGDVVRHVPVLQKLAMASQSLGVRYISRQQHPEVFVRFLTNGGEAIPKFIFLSSQFVECGNWGPMPAIERKIIARGKACNDIETARRKVSHLYEADNMRRRVIEELLELITVAVAMEP